MREQPDHRLATAEPLVAARAPARAETLVSPSSLHALRGVIGNQSMGMLIERASSGAVIARREGAPADVDQFNPESLVHDLRRAIDQSDTSVRIKPRKDPKPSYGFTYEVPEYEEYRKVDADAVIRALDNLTLAQIQEVKRLYAQQEGGRSLEHDLFEGGESSNPSDLVGAKGDHVRVLLQGTRGEQGKAAPNARVEADAFVLQGLMAKDLNDDESARERVMALHRRPVEEITELDRQYALHFGKELNVLVFDKLESKAQQSRMYQLRERQLAAGRRVRDRGRSGAQIDALDQKPDES